MLELNGVLFTLILSFLNPYELQISMLHAVSCIYTPVLRLLQRYELTVQNKYIHSVFQSSYPFSQCIHPIPIIENVPQVPSMHQVQQ
jgi:hypothetical protein